MGISDGLLPTAWQWICHALFLCVLVLAITMAPWPRLIQHRVLQHFFWGSSVFLAALWQMRAGLSPGLSIHFLGLTALTLAMGWSFAVIIGTLALLGSTLLGHESPEAFSFSALVAVVVPISTSYLVYLAERRAGFRLFFAYIFICAFFGGAIAAASAVCADALLLWLAGIYDMTTISEQLLTYLPLIVFPEGVINGMLITGLLVFFPRYLKTLDESRYLPPR